MVLIPLMLLAHNGIASEKILLLPFLHTAHVNLYAIVGEALVKSGHDVTIITHPRNKKVISDTTAMSVIYTEEIGRSMFVDSKEFQSGLFNMSMIKIVRPVLHLLVGYCESILANQHIMTQLQNTRYDLVIVEGNAMGLCLYAIPYKLGVPYISLLGHMDPWTVRVGALPSVEPFPIMCKTNDMDFTQRVTNTLIYVTYTFVLPAIIAYQHNYIVLKYVPEKPAIDLRDLHKLSQLWLVNWEPNMLDYPRVSTPYYHFIGGIAVKDANPLPADIEKFVQRNQNGCILLTFGSAIRNIPIDIMQKFLNTFEQIHFNVLLTNNGENPPYIPENVMIKNWLPQNDILGHPKIKLFINHGGNNGQLEALYHGVPQILFPIMNDQSYNSLKVKEKGFGLIMDVHHFTVQELVDNISMVTSERKYEKNAKRASAIFRSLPSKMDSVIFWVNHVINYGGHHLRPPYMNMPLYKFFLLDILAFFVLSFVSVSFVIIVSCKCCCRFCFVKTKEKTH